MPLTLESLTAKRADLTQQLEQHVGQINRINGAVALLDDLLKEVREAAAPPPVFSGIDRTPSEYWRNLSDDQLFASDALDTFAKSRPAGMVPPAPHQIQPYQAEDTDAA